MKTRTKIKIKLGIVSMAIFYGLFVLFMTLFDFILRFSMGKAITMEQVYSNMIETLSIGLIAIFMWLIMDNLKHIRIKSGTGDVSRGSIEDHLNTLGYELISEKDGIRKYKTARKKTSVRPLIIYSINEDGDTVIIGRKNLLWEIKRHLQRYDFEVEQKKIKLPRFLEDFRYSE